MEDQEFPNDPPTIKVNDYNGDYVGTFSHGDLVTAISNNAGEGMLYRVEKFKLKHSRRGVPRYHAYVVPVLSFWGLMPISRRKGKWFDTIYMKRVKLEELGKLYAEFGLFIQQEVRRLSGRDEEEVEDVLQQEEGREEPQAPEAGEPAGRDVHRLVAGETPAGDTAVLAR